ncbi:DUF948 domain-containing protein [Roseofilum sp. BLCC_M91]|uniref:DUF948 domain-containing protein n=1 Tax=Roseofilum halophilum BLCC-M91 TaxID=3022259 RepID=A0ABT7BKB1_9CYAN|nr:hypothetical protein [Roseofilum halophilum]MDJ1179212.1 DUF948 domain-containing protein [Roseofilum halophilum BLCC-M91]
MIDPLFWLGLSILLVAVSLTAVLIVAVPAVKELARAARSAEKLFDTLSRELPPTLESIRLTGIEISDLTDDVSQGVQRASKVAKQLDRGIETAREQAKGVQGTTRSVFTGLKVAWKRFKQPNSSSKADDAIANTDRPSLPSSDNQRYGSTRRK